MAGSLTLADFSLILEDALEEAVALQVAVAAIHRLEKIKCAIADPKSGSVLPESTEEEGEPC
jgi:hypothetical protein